MRLAMRWGSCRMGEHPHRQNLGKRRELCAPLLSEKIAISYRTPQHDVALIHERLKAAQQDYEKRDAKEA